MDLEQLRKFTTHILKEVGLISEEAVPLMMGTAVQESRCRYLYQLWNGPARSIWQVEPRTAYDNFSNYLNVPHRGYLRKQILETCFLSSEFFNTIPINTQPTIYHLDTIQEILTRNLAFALLMARIRYYRVPKAIPPTLLGIAVYWKKYYNTEMGSGSIQEFIDNYHKFNLTEICPIG